MIAHVQKIFALFVTIFAIVSAQESINPHEGFNVFLHAGIALLMSFGILASCAVGVNVLSKYCAKRIGKAE
ncbi:DgyrCDS9006 [Dimorphilus gyrociliatus]|uniref:DgyrCDS9006 n=1 Tax=Dimorphilus gyrociliatus TaxID=2664684 RepID=A0A7I8VY31_9ANNE|nr:DgyrCDS9006 [Dimorphilus gyrociliatus]